MTTIPTHTTDDTMISFYPVDTNAAKVLTDVARRYHLPQGAVDDRPQIDLPEGARIQIDGIWEGGYLSAHHDEFDFPVSHDEVPAGLYERLMKEHGPKKLNCPNCDGGWRDVEEDGRFLRDACYTCGNSGVITEDQYYGIRFRNLCAMLGDMMTQQMRKARNENPDGEGWAFCAAENMMSEYDYTMARSMGEADRAARSLVKLGEESPMLLRCIVDQMVPPDDSLYLPKTKKEKPVVKEQPKAVEAVKPTATPVERKPPCDDESGIPF